MTTEWQHEVKEQKKPRPSCHKMLIRRKACFWAYECGGGGDWQGRRVSSLTEDRLFFQELLKGILVFLKMSPTEGLSSPAMIKRRKTPWAGVEQGILRFLLYGNNTNSRFNHHSDHPLHNLPHSDEIYWTQVLAEIGLSEDSFVTGLKIQSWNSHMQERLPPLKTSNPGLQYLASRNTHRDINRELEERGRGESEPKLLGGFRWEIPVWSRTYAVFSWHLYLQCWDVSGKKVP